MRFEETELLRQGDVSPQIWVWLDQRSQFYTQVLILLHFGTRLRMVKNFLCILPPALPPPSFLLSTACQKKILFMWFSGDGGDSPFGNEISHIHAGLRTHFDQEPETMQILYHFRLELAAYEQNQKLFSKWQGGTLVLRKNDGYHLLRPFASIILFNTFNDSRR